MGNFESAFLKKRVSMHGIGGHFKVTTTSAS